MKPQLVLSRATLALGATGLSAGAPAVIVPEAMPPLAASPAQPSLSAAATRRNMLVGRRVTVRGALRAARGIVALQEHRRGGWVTLVRGATTRAGRFRLGYRPRVPGSIALRVRFLPGGTRRAVTHALPVVNVYRLAGASWYGPGGQLACGGTLTPWKLGVAHRTLPCGTMVRLHLGNRTVRVPVIDRGPFVAGRDFDLTPATKRALGFGDTGEIWSTR